MATVRSTRVSAAGIACDHCGLPVPDDEPFVVLAAKGSVELYRRCFHERCWPSVALDGIERRVRRRSILGVDAGGVPDDLLCDRCDAPVARSRSSSERCAVRGTTGSCTRSAGCTSAARWS